MPLAHYTGLDSNLPRRPAPPAAPPNPLPASFLLSLGVLDSCFSLLMRQKDRGPVCNTHAHVKDPTTAGQLSCG